MKADVTWKSTSEQKDVGVIESGYYDLGNERAMMFELHSGTCYSLKR